MSQNDEDETAKGWREYIDREQSLKMDLIQVLMRHQQECADGEDAYLTDVQQWSALVDLALTSTFRVHGRDRFRQMWLFVLESAEGDDNWMKTREGL